MPPKHPCVWLANRRFGPLDGQEFAADSIIHGDESAYSPASSRLNHALAEH